MINIEKILKQDRQIRATTGLNQQAFEALLPSFAEAYEEFRAKFGEVQEVIIDGTERPVQRPKDAERQRLYRLYYAA